MKQYEYIFDWTRPRSIVLLPNFELYGRSSVPRPGLVTCFPLCLGNSLLKYYTEYMLTGESLISEFFENEKK